MLSRRGLQRIARGITAHQTPRRYLAAAALNGLKASSVEITPCTLPKTPPANADLVFGKTFTDHMLSIEWDDRNGWGTPHIKPYDKLSLDPSSVVFHYAITCFEGMKAYKDKDGKIRLFRPDMNMKRMNKSAARITLPTFDGDEFLALIKKFVKEDAKWIPNERGYSLYLRPTMIGTQESLGVGPSSRALLYCIACPVGPYYKSGFNAVKLLATTEFVRAWPKGTGEAKIGGNYAPGIKPQIMAAHEGYAQNLWLFGNHHELTEVGTMNCFVLWRNDKGETELVTPPLDGAILPGVTRDSILALAREWNEFKVSERKLTMPQIKEAVKEGRLLEMFGAGTACIVSPIKAVRYQGEDIAIPLDPKDSSAQAGPWASRFNKAIMDIQYGEVEHPWSVVVD
ncbi:hypothetical protein BZG36_03375 [Bifiguratus adelaidae]|uniref:Branched-chain-amino-acid aminotransferase n=1 Tax=Bifiguratus adelaidae TaxID=1938954 RepID=A0A261XXR2_9FUNG|nr:hypothetical protein BZG36_03375 [Bifiguratus adelaidae]